MKYHRQQDGEWVRPVRRGYRLGCCDCGLVHVVDFRVYRGQVHFRAVRNRRATAQMRRHLVGAR
jgi:hypothetical protein